MERTLDECRWLWNHWLEERRDAYEATKQSLSRYDQQAQLPSLKAVRPTLRTVHSQVLQNVAVRLDLAFDAFFRRIRTGHNPGYPRFRGHGRYDSFCYPQSGFQLNETNVYLSKIGSVRIVAHRPAEGVIKTCCVKRSSTGKWYVTFSCEVEPTVLPATSNEIGLDMGLESFATFSTGEKIENPRFFRSDEKALATVQRRISKHEKGTRERRKKRKAVARVHERIKFRRHNFVHQESRKIVNTFDVIAIEDLSVNRMIHNHCLTKSIADASWAQFASVLTHKAENAGRQIIATNPAYTSQDCSRCGHRVKKTLSDRVHHCPCCGLVMDRDQNAALNILALGQQSLASA